MGLIPTTHHWEVLEAQTEEECLHVKPQKRDGDNKNHGNEEALALVEQILECGDDERPPEPVEPGRSRILSGAVKDSDPTRFGFLAGEVDFDWWILVGGHRVLKYSDSCGEHDPINYSTSSSRIRWYRSSRFAASRSHVPKKSSGRACFTIGWSPEVV